ncbi:MAG: 1,4-alpha-glucan branching protein GlgB [Clostridia bacterium]|nr:1,4-alpha-glucan branching protein GlgB [Clostridia bacterium]
MHGIAPGDRERELFHRGLSAKAYEWLGAHAILQEGEPAWHFAVWAPNAQAVSLVGEFNRWDRNTCPMTCGEDGIWEVTMPGVVFTTASDPERYSYPDAAEKLLNYKFAIQDARGDWHQHTDPFAFRMEQRPHTASRLCELSGHAWRDADWMAERAAGNLREKPVNVYEVHLGSWRRQGSGKDGTHDGPAGRVLSYTEIADQLIPYVREMGYTHVELLPVMEHPLDASWGYQVSGYFAATARYGEPEELMTLIDRCHQAGIGVILDWVPAHFPKDDASLRCFDGTCLYEHPDPRRGEMPLWGTCMFDLERPEVRSFLISSACFWLEKYHADGLRVDAVAAMLYHDFCREDGRWLPNRHGGRENLDGIFFLQKLNETVHRAYPGAVMIAEDSSAYPGVTHSPGVGGLGFDFKWDMGWMNDTLAYVRKDPLYRKWHHEKLTFSMMYAFSEYFMLPLSHDEVVHGKGSLLDKQPGDIWQKFAGLRTLYGYMMAHPGKKLLFMGGEFGQFIEWRCQDQLDWFLLRYDMHPQLQACVREMNRIYRETPALWEIEDSWDGFQWIQVDDRDNSVLAFLRKDRAGNALLCVCNFTPVFHPVYRIGLPEAGVLTELLNTDSNLFGGSNQGNPAQIHTEPMAWGGFQHSLELVVPPLATVWYRWEPRT